MVYLNVYWLCLTCLIHTDQCQDGPAASVCFSSICGIPLLMGPWKDQLIFEKTSCLIQDSFLLCPWESRLVLCSAKTCVTLSQVFSTLPTSSVLLLNSLPIAFDSLALKHRWKSFFHWSLVALILFLVSFLFSVFALMFEVASDVVKETSGARFVFHSEVFSSAFWKLPLLCFLLL